MSNHTILDIFSSFFRSGAADTLIPFLIIYTILYFAIDRAKLIPSKPALIILSLSISALVVFTTGLPFMELFRQIFSSTVMLLLFLIIFIIIAFFLGMAKGSEGGRETWLLIVAAILALYVIFKADIPSMFGVQTNFFDQIPASLIFLVGVIGVLLFIFSKVS